MSVRKRSWYICIYYKFSRPKRTVGMSMTDKHISCNVEKINIQPFRNLFFLLSTGNYVLGYLASRPKLVHYVLQALVQVCIVWLMCRNLSNVIESTIVFHLHILSLHLVTLKRLFPKTKSYTFIQIDLINIKFMI